ncbi:hypothetical protein VCSRO153_3665 [Vibrio cholerae]|nr:hypothetical protein VCSRO153_3665 [Vibrio cholerae]
MSYTYNQRENIRTSFEVENSITLTKVLLAASQMLNTNNPMEHGKVPVRDG